MMLPHVSTTRLAYTVPYEWCNRGMPLTQRLATHLQGVAVCCSVLQCVAIHIMSHVTYEWCNRGMPLTQGLATHVQCAAVCAECFNTCNESCHIRMIQWNESCHIWMSHVTYEWVMSHMNESRHIWMVQWNESCHIWMSHVPYEWCNRGMPLTQGLATHLQCVAACCSVLQCVAMYCSVLQCVAVHIMSRVTHAWCNGGVPLICDMTHLYRSLVT